MSDTAAHVPARPGRFIRMLRWLRDYESERAREYYSKCGVWSSRVYAILLPILVLLTAWADPSLGVVLYLGMGWGVLSRLYLWYQAKAVIAYQLIEEQHANRDQLNSFMPLIAIIALIILWAVIQVLYYADMSPRTISYTPFGWYMILVAFVDIGYDLRINNRVMFILSQVPSRVELRRPAEPSH